MNHFDLINEKKGKQNKNESESNFKNVKSKYILKQIFENLKKIKQLQISKYNNKMKKILDLSIHDYIKFSQIEIEIIPIFNKYDNFININNIEEESYYHIYFNNSKGEIKRTFFEKKDNVEKIFIKVDYQVQSFYKLFKNCNCIESIKFKKFF